MKMAVCYVPCVRFLVLFFVEFFFVANFNKKVLLFDEKEKVSRKGT